MLLMAPVARHVWEANVFTRKKSMWLFLLPGALGLMLFYIVPFIGGIWYSLTDGSYKNSFVGIKNYIDIWQNQMFVLGLKNTMLLSLILSLIHI